MMNLVKRVPVGLRGFLGLLRTNVLISAACGVLLVAGLALTLHTTSQHVTLLTSTKAHGQNVGTSLQVPSTVPGQVGSTTAGSSNTNGGNAKPGTNGNSSTTNGTTKSNKPTKALVVSPSTVVVYDPPAGIQGPESSATSPMVTFTSADGQAIDMPVTSSAFGMVAVENANNFSARSTWQLETDVLGESLGQYTVHVTANSPSGTTYTGSYQLAIKPMPTFSLTTQSLFLSQNQSLEGNIDISNIAYNPGNAPTPTLSIEDSAGVSCPVFLNFNSSILFCGSNTSIPAGSYKLSFVFENQYQRVVLPVTYIVNPG